MYEHILLTYKKLSNTYTILYTSIVDITQYKNVPICQYTFYHFN